MMLAFDLIGLPGRVYEFDDDGATLGQPERILPVDTVSTGQPLLANPCNRPTAFKQTRTRRWRKRVREQAGEVA